MKEMKVSTSLDSNKRFFLFDSKLYSCKCVTVALFISASIFLLGAFIGAEVINPVVLNHSTSAASSASFERSSSNTKISYSKVISNLENLKKNIEDYYESETSTFDQIMTGGMGVEYKSVEYQDAVEYVAKTFRRKLEDGDRNIIIGVIGSSVAAGHDNCNYDSFERQLERTMKPNLEDEIQFTVLNAGEGGGCGDTHSNQVFCVRQMVGEQADVVIYSWSYFEGGPAGHVEHEELIRWSVMLRNSPAVHILNAGGKENECLKDKWNPKLFEKYTAAYGFNAICLESALWSNGAYEGKEWGKVGDGVHTITRYGSYEGECDENSFFGCDYKAENIDDERRESLGVVWRNWHPGPLGFQLASDMFAYIYAEALIIALEEISNGVEKEIRRPVMVKDLGEPLFCDSRVCSLEEPPGCLNLEAPVYGYHQISIVPADDDLSPYLNADPQPLPVEDLSKQRRLAQDLSPGWKRNFYGGGDSLIPKLEKYDAECQHLDSCGGVAGYRADDSWLVFKLPKMEQGIVIICGCCGKQVATDMFIENEYLEIQFDGKTLDRSTFSLYPNGKCAKVLDGFPSAVDDPTGHLYLALRFFVDATQSSKHLKISHVIAF